MRSSSPATDSFAGGKTFVAGTVDLAAHSAAGTGEISFAGVARLEIEKAELTGHVYHNAIDFFGKVLDLRGLKFHPGATTAYHPGSRNLSVHSGHVTDTLTLVSHREHISVSRATDTAAARSRWLRPPAPARLASLAEHDVVGPHRAHSGVGTAHQVADYLFGA